MEKEMTKTFEPVPNQPKVSAIRADPNSQGLFDGGDVFAERHQEADHKHEPPEARPYRPFERR